MIDVKPGLTERPSATTLRTGARSSEDGEETSSQPEAPLSNKLLQLTGVRSGLRPARPGAFDAGFAPAAETPAVRPIARNPRREDHHLRIPSSRFARLRLFC